MYVIVRRFQFTVVSTLAFVSFLERHFFSSDRAFAKLEDGKILDHLCTVWALEIQARTRISLVPCMHWVVNYYHTTRYGDVKK
jgi:hypothetical protein